MLLKEVEEDKAAEYYKSQGPVIEVSYIGAHAAASLISKPEIIIAAISMHNIIDQYKKEDLDDIDPKELLPKEYYNLVDIFYKKKSDQLLLYQKGDH